MKVRYLLFALLFLFLVACQFNQSVKIINHEKPDLSVNSSAFSTEGCTRSGHGWYDCEKGTELYKLGCDGFRIESLLGGLEPNYPIAYCNSYFYDDEPMPSRDECLFINGFFIRTRKKLVILKNGKYQIVTNEKDFRAIYAPVTSPEEALGFALAIQDVQAYYGQTLNPSYMYEVKKIQDTFVDSIGSDYVVHLFYHETFGCGPHYTYAVDIRVSSDGAVKVIRRERVYRNPAEDDLCVD